MEKADEMVYLHPARARLPRPVLTSGPSNALVRDEGTPAADPQSAHQYGRSSVFRLLHQEENRWLGRRYSDAARSPASSRPNNASILIIVTA